MQLTIRSMVTVGLLLGFSTICEAAPILSAAHAPAVFYISSTGSDTNDGTTADHAWKTIDRANRAKLSPGDSLLFEHGQQFPGNLLITTSGTAAAPLIIASFGDGPATIEAKDSFGIRLLNCQYIRVHDLILHGAKIQPSGVSSNHAQGLDIFSSATTGHPWQNIYVDHLDVSGFWDGIVLHTPIGKQDVVGYNDVRITHCTVHECGFGGIYCWGSSKDSGAPWRLPVGSGVFTNFYIGDCAVHHIYGDPTGDPLLSLPIQILNATSSLVERCTIHHCGMTANPKGSQGGVGGLVLLECDRCVAQFNECHHIVTTIKYDGCAFDIDGGCTNCVLQYNYSHDNDGSGYQTGTFQGSGPVADNTIRFNISQNDAKKNPASCGGIMTWATQSRGHIYNNTVFISKGIDGKPAAFLGMGSGLDVRNNIFVSAHDGDIVRSGEGYRFQDNCYYRTDNVFSINFGGKHFSSLADWQRSTGQEMLNGAEMGFFTNPLLQNPGGGDSVDRSAQLKWLSAYNLLPSSPLIRKGLELKALFQIDPGPCDFHGTPLGKHMDLGAVMAPSEPEHKAPVQ